MSMQQSENEFSRSKTSFRMSLLDNHALAVEHYRIIEVAADLLAKTLEVWHSHVSDVPELMRCFLTIG